MFTINSIVVKEKGAKFMSSFILKNINGTTTTETININKEIVTRIRVKMAIKARVSEKKLLSCYSRDPSFSLNC